MADLRESNIKALLGDKTYNEVKKSKILVVGAGGIGCELLKNLVLTGFTNLEVIDLDTIDLSNLNRQFLFAKKHVGQSKSAVATETVLKFNPYANIKSHHGNIKNYGYQFFSSFNLVMNALDNLEARRYVNRMCLATNTPLVESGSAGYLGQVSVIRKDLTACYDCEPKPVRKTFPVCTIRSTPSTSVHCLVWAKMIFGKMFGQESDSIEELEDDGDAIDESDPQAELKAKQKEQDKDLNMHVHAHENVSDEDYFELIFKKLFHDDIQGLLSLDGLWETRKPPVPMKLEEVMSSSNDNVSASSSSTADSAQLSDQRIWSQKECAEKLKEAIQSIRRTVSSSSILSWDKDHEPSLNFVTALANLRCYIFDIPNESKWSSKGTLGNIIPAIATTNAVIAALVVMEGISLLGQGIQNCKSVYLLKAPSRHRMMFGASLDKPKPTCSVCSASFLSITMNLSKATMKDFVDQVLTTKLKITEPMVTFGSSLILDFDDEEEDKAKQLAKILSEFGLQDNTLLAIQDYASDVSLSLTLFNDPDLDAKTFRIQGDLEAGIKRAQEKAKAIEESAKAEAAAQKEEEERKASLGNVISLDDDDDDDENESMVIEKSSNSKKRKREEEDEIIIDEQGSSTKKIKQ